MASLEVSRTIVDACRFAWTNRRDLLDYAALPVVVLSLFQVLEARLLPSAEAPDEAPSLHLSLLADTIVYMVVYTMFSVAWYRRYLIGVEGPTVGAALRWRWRHMVFLGRFIIVTLLPTILMLYLAASVAAASTGGAGAPAGVPNLLILVALVAILLAWARLLLVLPAAAIDDDASLVRAWRLSRGNSWRMLGIAILPAFPAVLVVLIVTAVVAQVLGLTGLTESLTARFVAHLIQQLLLFIGTAIGISALSIAYLRLTAVQGPSGT
ncbi:MAG: hypothetical protein ACE5Q3_09865 [Alphaproteobacteria bacterium]